MLALIVYFAFNVYALGLIIYVACTWIQHPTAAKVREWLHRWYEPVLEALRRAIKPVTIGTKRVDFTPLVLLVGIMIARKLVVSSFLFLF